jgi:hypothetical protein
MRKLLVVALALGLLLCFVACGAPVASEPPPFDVAAYGETLRGYFRGHGGDILKVEEAFRPLADWSGELPDEAVVGFVRNLEMVYKIPPSHIDPAQEYLFLISDLPFCYPDFRAIAAALTGKLGLGAARLLELKAKEKDYEYDNEENFSGHQTQMHEAWREFNKEYPALTGDELAVWMGP